MNPRSIETKNKRRRISRRWKGAEDWWWKQIQDQSNAKRLGHIRRGVSCPDMKFWLFSLEVTTQKAPEKIFKEMRDAQLHAGTDIPLVAFHRAGDDMMDGIVQMTVRDFLGLVQSYSKEGG
jgi:hypothetical protein